MAPAQLVVFIEKQAGERMTPSLSEAGAGKGLLWGAVRKNIISDRFVS